MPDYDAIEASLHQLLQDSGIYAESSISRGDFSIFGIPKPAYLVLNPGPISQRQVIAYPRYIQETYTIYLELFIPYENITEVWQSIRDIRQRTLQYLDRYPTINDTPEVINMFVTSTTVPMELQGSGRRWWKQTLNCDIIARDMSERL